MKIIKLNFNENLSLLKFFIENAGESLLRFRYFNKRPLDIIKNHFITYIGLNDQNEPVCYGHLDRENNNVWLGICVVNSEINKGYGNGMMDALLAYAKTNNIDNILLSVDTDNQAAKRLYEKRGFKLIDTNDQISYYMLGMR